MINKDPIRNKLTQPIVSIITVVKNGEKYLEETIKSVINQKYKNIEYIIIDGLSTDNSREIINKYRKYIHVYKRQKDRNLWDAMNKGIKCSNGSILAFVNSDDIFNHNAVNHAVKYFQKKKIDFVFGTVHKFYLKYGFNSSLSKITFNFYTTHSMGFFVKKKVHDEIGFYNIKFLSADLDFFLRMIFSKKYKGCGTKKTELFGYFRPGGFSSKIKYRTHLKDLNEIRINNNQNRLFVFLLYLFKIIKNLKKFILNIH